MCNERNHFHHEKSLVNPLKYSDDNLIGTLNLYKVMRKHDCNKEIAASASDEELSEFVSQVAPYRDVLTTGKKWLSPINGRVVMSDAEEGQMWQMRFLYFFCDGY